jgi:hypothetical protein
MFTLQSFDLQERQRSGELLNEAQRRLCWQVLALRGKKKCLKLKRGQSQMATPCDNSCAFWREELHPLLDVIIN